MAKIRKMKVDKKEKRPNVTLIYIFLIPMFISTISSLLNADYIKFLSKIVGFGLLFGSVNLIKKGLEEEKKYNKATYAQAPKRKYKLYGYVVLFIALIIIALLSTRLNPLNGVFTALLGAIGAYMYYGKDPSVDKIPKDAGVNYAKLIKDINEAEQKLKEIDEQKKRVSDTELKVAIDNASKKAHEILETIKEDPKDINIARKFMVVYLDGVKDVISQYQSVDKELLDNSFRDRMIELLIGASQRFERELERLKSNEIFDLDVQIDALKEQLKH